MTTSQVGATAPVWISTSTFHPYFNSIKPEPSPHQTSEPIFPKTISSSSTQSKSRPHPHLRPSGSNSNLASNPATVVVRATAISSGSVSQCPRRPAPEYDLIDEESLPTPFLKKSDHQNSSPAVGPMIQSHYYRSWYFYVDFVNSYYFAIKKATQQ